MKNAKFYLLLLVILLSVSCSSITPTSESTAMIHDTPTQPPETPSVSPTHTNTAIPASTETKTPASLTPEEKSATPTPTSAPEKLITASPTDAGVRFDTPEQALTTICSNNVHSLSERTIAFVANWDGDDEIYLVQANGQGIVQLTNNRVNDSYPQWSPDGKTIAAISSDADYYRNTSLYLMNVSGELLQTLTPDTLFLGGSFAWSPGGHQIAFNGSVAGDNDEPLDMYVVSIDSGEIINLTRDVNLIGAFYPTWAPDSLRLAFNFPIEPTFSNWWIATMPADGSDFHQIPSESFEGDQSPDWHPFAETILYIAHSLDRPNQLFMMDANGENRRQVTAVDTNITAASWSPNGQWIAYTATIDFFSEEEAPDNYQLHLLSADGEQDILLFQSSEDVYSIQWSPDGRYIAYVQSGVLENIYVIDICDLSVSLVVENVSYVDSPQWKSDEK